MKKVKTEKQTIIRKYILKEGGKMATTKFILKIITTEIKLYSNKENYQFINVSNIKIETVESYVKRNGEIIQLDYRSRETRKTNSRFLYTFQKAA